MASPETSPLSAGVARSFHADAASRREALLQAALELMAERTYGATAVPDIAARARVGAGTVYRHFESKADLANAVFRHCKGAMQAAMQAALDAEGEVDARFEALWLGLAALARRDPRALRFLELQHHDEYLDGRSRALSDAVFDRAAAFVREGQQAGRIAPESPAVVIALVFGAFVGLFKESCAGRVAFDDETVAAAGRRAWCMIAAR
jgi:AcrR family transcriptional regulator